MPGKQNALLCSVWLARGDMFKAYNDRMATKTTSTALADIAPTLRDLKGLPVERQAKLLLARLAVLYPQMRSSGGLHKGNFLLPDDPYGLALGYSHAENEEVRRHLLSAPWTILVNRGYIVDPAGNGFYSVSEEGYEAMKNSEPSSNYEGSAKGGYGALRTAIVFNVLIASPADVSEERDVVTAAIHAWNAANYPTTGIMLNPVRWETHSFPESGDRPQAIVNRQIVDEGDFLIGIFGNRLGTPTGSAQSGTIEEIERFRKAGKHVALYFSTSDVPRNADREQLAALEKYQREREKDTLYFTFGSSNQLRLLVTQHLPRIVAEVDKRLRSTDQMEGVEDQLRSTRQHAGQRLQKLVDQTTRQIPTDTANRLTMFDETKPLVPEYASDQKIPTHAYQTWMVRPRQSLNLRLDRSLEDSLKKAIQTQFQSIVPGNFYPPIVTAKSHVIRWQARVSGGGKGALTYVRYLEVTPEGALRYAEKIDRHETRQESVSDLFIGSLQFWGLVSEFYMTRKYSGSLSVLHRIDCTADVQFFPTFPDASGVYHQTNAISFPEAREYGIAEGSSRHIREIILFEKREDRQEIVVDSILAHLRELCEASVDYDQLRTVVSNLPDRAPIPPY